MQFLQTLIHQKLNEAQTVLSTFMADVENITAIERAAGLMADALKRGGKIMSCGNGGSLGDAMHFAEQAGALAARHQSLALLQAQADQLRDLCRAGRLPDIQFTQVDATLTRLTDAMGRCERLKNTVFPRTCTFYPQVFIILFTAMLPFGFVENLFFVEAPLVTLIGSAFFQSRKGLFKSRTYL